MRSLLFVPGHDARKMEKSLSSGADALILDLEDAVPEPEKATARRLCGEFVLQHGQAMPIFVRINEIGSEHWKSDLDVVLLSRPYGVMLPKCQGPEDLDAASSYLTTLEHQYGLPDQSIRVLPIVTETAASLFQLGEYARVKSSRLCAMLWGGEDLAADIGASRNRDADNRYTPTYQLARSLTLLGATAARVAAIDAVYSRFRDNEGLRAELEEAVQDGFFGKAAIHPDQVKIINDAFTPSADELEAARRVVAAYESPSSNGVATLDGKMIVKPYYLAAKRVLARLPGVVQQ